MTVRIMRQRQSLRQIEQLARQTADPVERLRYVRNQMNSRGRVMEIEWWRAGRLAAAIAIGIVAALLAWRIR